MLKELKSLRWPCTTGVGQSSVTRSWEHGERCAPCLLLPWSLRLVFTHVWYRSRKEKREVCIYPSHCQFLSKAGQEPQRQTADEPEFLPHLRRALPPVKAAASESRLRTASVQKAVRGWCAPLKCQAHTYTAGRFRSGKGWIFFIMQLETEVALSAGTEHFLPSSGPVCRQRTPHPYFTLQKSCSV